MPFKYSHPKLIQQSDLRRYFQESVSQALGNQNIKAEDGTIIYLANLLTVFTRSENLFEFTRHGLTLRPLALHYEEAVNAASPHARNIALQRLGDIALFISGIFSQSLSRKPVDIDYYINMGGSAYAYLADIRDRRLNDKALGEIFAELAQKFVDFMDVLNEVCEKTHANSHKDLLRLYEVWSRTGSKRIEKQLRQYGMHLEETKPDQRPH